MEEVDQKLLELSTALQAKHIQEDKVRGALLELHLAKLAARDTDWGDLLPDQQTETLGRIDAIELKVLGYLKGINPQIKTLEDARNTGIKCAPRRHTRSSATLGALEKGEPSKNPPANAGGTLDGADDQTAEKQQTEHGSDDQIVTVVVEGPEDQNNGSQAANQGIPPPPRLVRSPMIKSPANKKVSFYVDGASASFGQTPSPGFDFSNKALFELPYEQAMQMLVQHHHESDGKIPTYPVPHTTDFNRGQVKSSIYSNKNGAGNTFAYKPVEVDSQRPEKDDQINGGQIHHDPFDKKTYWYAQKIACT